MTFLCKINSIIILRPPFSLLFPSLKVFVLKQTVPVVYLSPQLEQNLVSSLVFIAFFISIAQNNACWQWRKSRTLCRQPEDLFYFFEEEV